MYNGAVRMVVTGNQGTVGMKVEKSGSGGAAVTARRLETKREIRLSGSAQGMALFDGSADADIYTALDTMSNEDLEGMLK